MRQRSELRSVQVRLIEEMKSSEGVLIVLGMGGGKTVSALTAISDLQNSASYARPSSSPPSAWR